MQQGRATLTLDGEQETRDVPRLDGHGDVEVEADAELGEPADEAAARTDEVPVLDLTVEHPF